MSQSVKSADPSITTSSKSPSKSNSKSKSKSLKAKKYTKKEKKLYKKKKKALKRGDDWWEPIDKSKCITLHLVHRSTDDPLLNIPDEHHSEWVLEPEINSRNDFERLQRYFNDDNDNQDIIPFHYRSDDYNEKTSAKSMPIRLPSQIKRNTLNPIFEQHNHNYDYNQHYKAINNNNFISLNTNNDQSSNNKLKLKDGVQILEQYIFEEDYDDDNDDNNDNDDDMPQYLRNNDDYKDYMDLLMSDDDDKQDIDDNDDKNDDNDTMIVSGDLNDDFMIKAMDIKDDDRRLIQLSSNTAPYGARFANMNEIDKHNDKYQYKDHKNKHSLYDQTINHLMNIQQAKLNNSTYLDDIKEEIDGQFDDADDDDDDDDDDCDSMNGMDGMDGDITMTNDGSIAYNPSMSLFDNQFEMMLNRDYNDDLIGELDDEYFEQFKMNNNNNNNDPYNRFTNKNKKESLRYQYYLYLKHRHRRIRRSLKKSSINATLDLMAINNGNKPKIDQKIQANIDHKDDKIDIKDNDDDNDDESDEIIFFSDSDSDKDINDKNDKNNDDNDDNIDDDDNKIDIMDLDSDDDRIINYELEQEFKKKAQPKWDVESILSTRTDHENHPNEIKVNVVKLKKDNNCLSKNIQKHILQNIGEEKQLNNDIKDDIKDNNDMFNFSFGNIGGDIDNNDITTKNKGNKVIFEFNKFDDNKNNNLLKIDNDITDIDKDKDKDIDNKSLITVYSTRNGESKKDKKERKRLIKLAKQQRRKEKKANKNAFKTVDKKQNKLNVTQRKSHSNAMRL